MSLAPLLYAMEDLLRAHEELIKIADEKTEILIKGDTEALQKILLTERKSIKALSKAENERQKQSEHYALENDLTEQDVTVTSLLERLSNPTEQAKLEEIATKLVNCITDLKRKEEMNQSLIQQSMQFIQFSLDVMNPTIQKMNYGTKHNKTTNARSTFDSQA